MEWNFNIAKENFQCILSQRQTTLTLLNNLFNPITDESPILGGCLAREKKISPGISTEERPKANVWSKWPDKLVDDQMFRGQYDWGGRPGRGHSPSVVLNLMILMFSASKLKGFSHIFLH